MTRLLPTILAIATPLAIFAAVATGAGGGRDIVCGGAGADQLSGGAGRDRDRRKP